MSRYDPMTALPQPTGTYDLGVALYVASRTYEKYVIPCSIPPFFFDVDNAKKTNTWKTGIETLTRNAISEFIFGTRDINNDSVWADYIAQVKKAGLDDYLKVMQSDYDKNWKGTMPKTYTAKPQRTN